MNVILQSESSECGLACVAMIASHHGQRISLRELRSRSPLSIKGASLQRLMTICSEQGFQCRALRLNLDDLSKVRAPCILHWDLNHYVVLTKVGRDKVTINDPAVGRRVLSLDETSAHFTGVALELT